MTEKLLQFIWQFQYFNKNELTTTSGDVVSVIAPGSINFNQGPDFSNARIKIGSDNWAGAVELHVRTSDWNKHQHTLDKNYRNVVLHVVWLNDAGDNQIHPEQPPIPLLELQPRVSNMLLLRYEELMNAPNFIPCGKAIQTVPALPWKSWLERLLAERLARKAYGVTNLLHQLHQHWEETCWVLLARNFGMNVNAACFEAVARTLPLTLIAKHKNQIHQLEALLLGQAGLLDGHFTEEYPKLLQREYLFLKHKHALSASHLPAHFLRMRPGNFPTIRLAQLAALLHNSEHLFSVLKEAADVNEIERCLDICANDYWHYHYKFDEISSFKVKKIGAVMTGHLIMNTFAPLLFAYGTYHREERYQLKALQWMETTLAEKNSITRGFLELGVEAQSGYESQALLELKNEYCNKRRCLECAVGNALLKPQRS